MYKLRVKIMDKYPTKSSKQMKIVYYQNKARKSSHINRYLKVIQTSTSRRLPLPSLSPRFKSNRNSKNNNHNRYNKIKRYNSHKNSSSKNSNSFPFSRGSTNTSNLSSLSLTTKTSAPTANPPEKPLLNYQPKTNS